MTGVYFARPRHDYPQYHDLYDLITHSGFPLIYFDEIDPQSDNVYIMTIVNGENEHGFKHPRARIILLDLEWRETAPRIPGVLETWVGDAHYATRIGGKYVPLGSHRDLYQVQPAPPQYAEMDYHRFLYDAAYMGYMIPRRQRILTELETQRVVLSPPSAWGIERNWVLEKSRAYLHIHQKDHFPCLPSLRMVVAAAYRLPFITEQVTDAGKWEQCIIQFPYSTAASLVHRYTRSNMQSELETFANALHYCLCEDWTFKKAVEWAL